MHIHGDTSDNRNDSIYIHVNGELLPKKDAMVSVYDSGFLLGDGVWEGLRVYDGIACFLEEHLDRLFAGALMIGLSIGHSKAELTNAIYALLSKNEMSKDVHIRLMVTRGVKSRPFQDPRLSKQGSTVVIIAEHNEVVGEGQQGTRLFTVPMHRGSPITQDPRLNSHSKLNCIVALNHAIVAGADEALMLDPLGFVNTTNSSNFFIVRNNEVWTSTGAYCMQGITRQKVIELCRSNNIVVKEKDFSLVDVYSADEAFLTGTLGAQSCVISVDGRNIGATGTKSMLKAIQNFYNEDVATYVQTVQRDGHSLRY